jgi:hypothetical protein
MRAIRNPIRDRLMTNPRMPLTVKNSELLSMYKLWSVTRDEGENRVNIGSKMSRPWLTVEKA